MPATDDDDVPLERAHDRRRLPARRARPQTALARGAPEPLSPDVTSLQRKALINGGVAAVLTGLIGFMVLSTSGAGLFAPPGPTSSPSLSPPPACAPAFEVLPTVDPKDGGNLLLGVSALSATDAWAVGGSGDPSDPTETLYEHWDGETWSAVDGPNPGTALNELAAVDQIAADNAWAVGRTGSGFGDDPLITHFDGATWDVQPIPAAVTDGALTAVSAAAVDDIWAVGSSGDASLGLEHVLALHFDGTGWTSVDATSAAGGGRSMLSGVSALASDDVWAVGYHHNEPLILHFDGKRWRRSPTDVGGFLHAVAAVATTDVWAVGSPIQHFAGDTWVERGSVRDGTDLRGTASVGGSDVWAVGSRTNGSDSVRAAVLRWDGGQWTPVAGEHVPGQDTLAAVTALPDGTVIAVGARDGAAGRMTLAIRGADCLG